jgi:hypothetical protein
VQCRKRLACLGLVIAMLAACGQEDPRVRLLKRLAEVAGQANQAAPADIDANTRLDSAKAGPGLRLTIAYTLVDPESEGVNRTTFDAKLTPVVQDGSCKNTELRPLIDQGVLVVLEYRGNDGKPIGTIRINRDTCRAIPMSADGKPP